ncbi:Leukotoxin LukD [Staphylococcus aureus]|uniref:Leukotoxin LukD n=1 Tax=Staphylococcus aureus TaxID=1280 RepID=A0A380EJF3_STAAU|nr:Leukotoxin LukD [Staphylococcus aureus]
MESTTLGGNNYKNQNTVTFTSTYEVDWQNHTVKLIGTDSKELILEYNC